MSPNTRLPWLKADTVFYITKNIHSTARDARHCRCVTIPTYRKKKKYQGKPCLGEQKAHIKWANSATLVYHYTFFFQFTQNQAILKEQKHLAKLKSVCSNILHLNLVGL